MRVMSYDVPIPAIPIFRQVKSYAAAKGLPFWKWRDIRMAADLYVIAASRLN